MTGPPGLEGGGSYAEAASQEEALRAADHPGAAVHLRCLALRITPRPSIATEQ